MRIAICDDDPRERSRLSDLLDVYCRECGEQVSYSAFPCGTELISAMQDDAYELILLDVLMPGQDGIQTAREIRSFDRAVKLIFLTSSPEFAAQSYSVDAFYYLLKPTAPKTLFPLLEKVRRELRRQEDDCLLLKGRAGVERIALHTLEYMEVINKTVFFHMDDGHTLEAAGTLADFEEDLLSHSEFCKVHRSYLLNLRRVRSLGPKGAITQSGRGVPVARAAYTQVKEAYMQLLFAGKPHDEAPPAPAPQPAPPNSDALRVLLVDDQPDQLDYWSGLLRAHGCQAVCADSADSALSAVMHTPFDCILLDVLLPDCSGLALCPALKEHSSAPVIFLSCVTDTDRQLEGFLAGGVDYITKDTPPHLFWAKVEARIRLNKESHAPVTFGPLSLDLAKRRLLVEHAELSLTPTEFDLLRTLSSRPGQVFTPEELYRTVWGTGQWDDGQTIQVHMSRLRRKLETAYSRHYFIETVWGKGYRFSPPDSR